jgi:phage-related protein
MKCISVALAIALFLAVCVPAVLAQDQPAAEQPVVEPPIIPPDIAQALSGNGVQPVISLGFDILFAFVNGVIALVMVVIGALWSRGLGSFMSLLMAWIWVIQSMLPVLTYAKGIWHVFSFILRYIPFLACIPYCWNAIKVTLQFFGI